jgi:hypothetical protein
MASAIFQGIAQLLQQRRPWVGPLEFDCSIHEDHAAELALTDNPIEALPGQPGVITDHATLLPRALTMTVMVSNSPDSLLAVSGFLTPTRHIRLWRKLLDLFRLRSLVLVITTLELYPAMLITRVSAPRENRTTNCLEITVNLRQVLFAAVPGVQELSDAAAELALAEQDVGAQATQTRALSDLVALL